MKTRKNVVFLSTIFFKPTHYLGMFVISFFLFALVGCDNNLKDADAILAAVPEKYKSNPSEYILKSVQLAARLETEIANAKNTSISEEIQEKMAIVKKSDTINDGGKPQINQMKMMSTMSMTNCPGDTIEGVKFDFTPLLASLYLGQQLTSVTDLTFEGYGIYVRFAEHGATKPASYTMSNTEWAENYANKKTVFINYSQNLTGNNYKLLVDSSGKILGDNIGMICPNYCPQ